MYTVTAIYDGCEIGFGECDGDTSDYAIEECIDSIPQIYKDCADRQMVKLVIRHESGVIFPVTWFDTEMAAKF